ncbi:peptide-methionine (S)-S-oxide reductase MsrA [Robiginitalea sp. SC105]|uniref:peptide-methionine (S)-S-oxide reductase MsrA n=1 Tax=Robiginitalea sp. SC105 TaxID=2762332 RepID=UPI00163AC65D|nr:peptide-methionine (S)-S-oxide reductase MsrA [Robiginitalea sp. SC105]MBC2839987.1 peptide-methionine (S)-S-oxide reductase MsrA [Robiginitalea sp. SC105]
MKHLRKTVLITAGLLLAVACQSKAKNPDTSVAPSTAAAQETAVDLKSDGGDTSAHDLVSQNQPQDLSQYDTAYFASGCFWCVEAIFESVRGVAEVESGYAGGTEENPTYEQVSYGRTGHAEAVKVYYDPKVVSFFELVQVFFGSHNPTTLNRQGPDRGAQYRSIAFYENETERKIITAYMKALEDNKVYNQPIVTEVSPLKTFYKAEEYHQDYERKHPDNPYIQNVSIPRLNRFKANFQEYLKEDVH